MNTATYTVEVAWASAISGGFVIGTSMVGSTDKIGTHTITGWTDETANAKMISISRGSPDDLGKVLGGTCTIVLSDTNGRYNPTNVSSVLYPNVIPMRAVRVKATYSATDYYRFYGFIQTIESDPSRGRQESVLNCADLYSWLSLSFPIISANGVTTTTGAAIQRIIIASGFLDPSLYAFDTGDTIADFSCDGSQSALSLIQNLVTAEQGTFFVSRSGVATYLNRYARFQAPRTSDQSTIGGTMYELSGVTDISGVLNIGRFTRTGGTQQVYSLSTTTYGKRVKTLTSTYWVNDAQALSAATFFIELNKAPKNPVRIIINGNSSDELMTALLVRDLNDRIGISESYGGTTGSFFVESVNETIEGGAIHSAEIYLSKLPTSVPENYGNFLQLVGVGNLELQSGANLDLSG